MSQGNRRLTARGSTEPAQLPRQWGEHLRLFRLKAGCRSQGELAESMSTLAAQLTLNEWFTLEEQFGGKGEHLFVSNTVLSYWETGKRNPPRSRARHLYLIWALHRLGGLESILDADGWLAMAGLIHLSLEEKRTIWPELFALHRSGNALPGAAQKSFSSQAIHPNGKLVARGTQQGKIGLWHIEEKRCVSILDNHHGLIRAIYFSQDGQQLISVCEDGYLCIWSQSSKNQTPQKNDPLDEPTIRYEPLAVFPVAEIMASL